MTGGLPAAAVASAFEAACRAELDALKPGNVHRFAGGHGMDAGLFQRSAAVSAPHVAAEGLGVGARVLGAVRATWDAVAMNTNLGIVLLCAPLAAAAERTAPGGDAAPRLQDAVRGVLGGLTPADAAAVFAAIAHASPGGLGRHAAHDVRRAPAIGLVEAMRIAAPVDLVARQYAEGFAAVFGLGLAALAASRRDGEAGMWPAVRCFLAFAAAFPDSHVARKFGPARAGMLRRRMEDFGKHLNALADFAAREAALARLDRALKDEGLNPGTSADLTVASIFTEALLRNLEQ